MSERKNYPHYNTAIAYYIKNDLRSLTRFMQQKSTELSLSEKKLLKARVFMKGNQLAEAAELLKTLSSFSSNFFKCERDLISASVLSRQGKHEAAADANRNAFQGYSSIGDRRGRFLSSYNLSADLCRLGRMEEADRYLEIANSIAEDDSERELVLRGLAAHASKKQDFNLALKHLEALEMQSSNPLDRNMTKMVILDVLVRKGDFQKAKDIADSITPNHRDPELPLMLFGKQAVDFLIGDSPWTCEPPAGVSASEEFTLKWKILHHLQNGEMETAKQYWRRLSEIAPNVYGDHFSSRRQEELNPFFRCIAKLANARSLQLPETAKACGRQLQLIEILKTSQFPLRKEAIIEALWQTSYDPKYDSRFYKLVERCRRELGVSIQIRNRTYSLSPS